MHLIGFIFSILADFYILVILIQVALSWLIAFDIINANNEAARNLTGLLKKLTDPVYTPLRKYVPPIGGIDITPLIVILGIAIIKSIIFGP